MKKPISKGLSFVTNFWHLKSNNRIRKGPFYSRRKRYFKRIFSFFFKYEMVLPTFWIFACRSLETHSRYPLFITFFLPINHRFQSNSSPSIKKSMKRRMTQQFLVELLLITFKRNWYTELSSYFSWLTLILRQKMKENKFIRILSF